MRSFCVMLVLVSSLALCEGCGGNNEATKPAVIPASPGTMPASGGTGGAVKAGSTTKPSEPL